jgi:hypothetical protein
MTTAVISTLEEQSLGRRTCIMQGVFKRLTPALLPFAILMNTGVTSGAYMYMHKNIYMYTGCIGRKTNILP